MELIPGYPSVEVEMLDDETWPSSEALGLNASQYKAYKLALTHEFAVIQGPPGTGKTFLGVKVAKTLLENVSKIRLLLICFTNHALDQFLEAISEITDSIVRVGGQSRNENMQKYNLTKLRSKHRDTLGNKLFYEQRYELQRTVAQMQTLQKKIDDINNGILPYELVKSDSPALVRLEEFYSKTNGDPLTQWLFDNLEYNDEFVEDDEEEDAAFAADAMDVDDDPNRMGAIIDDFDDEFDIEAKIDNEFNMSIETKFNVTKAKAEIKQLQAVARETDNDNYYEEIQMQIEVRLAQIKRLKVKLYFLPLLSFSLLTFPRNFPIIMELTLKLCFTY